ncbi:hypothetical protein TcarDRAFT_0910 [Thermosinus carboxydivorans Nor1]|uniref:Uncharacterized protein n=1 Tax=Thermosinus carboxydivorans Nor1 TaxID=401526 RepID=A1HSL1_9FIRM|nr:hypothetical protein TcarDRAFT_0910 [Thermosinus carboxydivorans Nor1]
MNNGFPTLWCQFMGMIIFAVKIKRPAPLKVQVPQSLSAANARLHCLAAAACSCCIILTRRRKCVKTEALEVLSQFLPHGLL